jgi:tRNA-specific 2-thiouridylase
MKLESKKRVLVAMSGGVDSSVATALLKKQGFAVSGVFMRLNNFSKKSEQDARKVAKKLDIPFYVWDFQKEFKKKVVEYFINEYQCGQTPNPCVECNKFIKFGILLEKAKKMGFDYLATGHYVRIKKSSDTFELLKAKDDKKDQSYFLWQLNQKQLARVLFPIGGYKKEEIRKIAQKMKLPVFDKKDSQEVCFIQNANVREFLNLRINMKKGVIITMGGEKIGEHEGLAYYTIGQRKGIKVSNSKPLYVVAKDYKKNALIVSENEKDLLRKEIIVERVNWPRLDLQGKNNARRAFECQVKIRSTAKPIKVIITKLQDTRYKVIFKIPQRAIASGQSAVFYSKDKLLGGGIIM